ncbi:hypothetical protein N7462_011436 [Penicillium macrosclerotiorum]|uniref:uncharacterized protein n=1 Tax=Penicillium macrosclerotiorum TaxID=303699 RepID=UPI0025488FD3|nr:uncharacterized protein N7462_011436 [Penicillium macrosclerotiorum]KAJ5664623.1 hypothetical protein N7462_011436 [Penicillium macrosclerotiorum]
MPLYFANFHKTYKSPYRPFWGLRVIEKPQVVARMPIFPLYTLDYVPSVPIYGRLAHWIKEWDLNVDNKAVGLDLKLLIGY